jgi:hypothetical protein
VDKLYIVEQPADRVVRACKLDKFRVLWIDPK